MNAYSRIVMSSFYILYIGFGKNNTVSDISKPNLCDSSIG